MEYVSMLNGRESTIATLNFVGNDNTTKEITIYAFCDMDGNPSYYEAIYHDRKWCDDIEIKDWLDGGKWITEDMTKGSFEDAVEFVKKYVRGMGCDDTITNDDVYKLKVKGGERAFFIANGMIYSAGCMCAAVDTPDGIRKHYSMWMKPKVSFTEDLIFVTKEEAESHLGDDKFDIGKLGLLNGEEIRNF